MGDGGERIFVCGAGGHAKVIIDIIERQGIHRIDCLVDRDPSLKGRKVFGYDVIGDENELLARTGRDVRQGIVAIGSNTARLRVARWLAEHGFGLITAVHPSARVSRGVELSAGSVIMAGVVLNADALIGENVIINTGATVDHDCIIANGVHLAPGATLCGNVRVGEGTLVGAGATIIPNITIGGRVVVGAGATVVSNVPDGVVVMGTPARVVRKLQG
jgi:sugar O-acyltransferase (sialic acid O-acetyltransferase NeuD family)